MKRASHHAVAAMMVAIVAMSAQAEDTIKTQADAFNVGKAFGKIEKETAGSKVNSTTGSQQLPHYATTAPETANFRDGRNLIGGAGANKQIQCQTFRGATAFQQQECDAVNFMSQNPTRRPKFTIDKKTDPILVGSKDVINQPGKVPGAPTQQCRVEKITHPATFVTETCTETQTLDTLSCKRILKVACDPERDGCDQGGIVPNSWAGDMATSFTPDGAGNHILQFGTIEDNYWRGWGAIYDRNLTFEIRDVNLISRFALTRAAFDDWLLVRVNGVLVYVGPHGGDRLEIYSPPPIVESSGARECSQYWSGTWLCFDKRGEGTHDVGNAAHYPSCTAVSAGWNCAPADPHTGMVQHCATCFGSPELNTSWNIGLNIDIKPHLRDGSNTIFMRTIVGGKGEGAIQITTRQLCPRNCHDQWDNSQCAPLEARSRP